MDNKLSSRIAVISAGAPGLAAAKYLLAEGFQVNIFESKGGPGGVWNTDAGNGCAPNPVYEGLETNVPRTLMTLSDFPWPADISPFPRSTVQPDTGRGNLKIEYSTKVTELRKATNQHNPRWKIRIEQKLFGRDMVTETHRFRAVVVAIGNYHSENVPWEIKGLSEWADTHRGTLTHSVEYRKAEAFENQAPSGWDISALLAGVAKKVIVSSNRYDPSRGPSQSSSPSDIGVPGLHRLDAPTKTVTFADGSVHQVDRIIFCTGYRYDFSFIKKRTAAGDKNLFEAGDTACNVYRHIFYTEDPTLAFVGLPTMSAAFTVAGAQSVVIARTLSGRLYVPSKPALRKWYADTSEADQELVRTGQADARHYHSFPLTEDKAYVNKLLEWSLHTKGVRTIFGDDGQSPPFWCGYFDAARAQSRAVRTAFKALGDQRHVFSSPSAWSPAGRAVRRRGIGRLNSVVSDAIVASSEAKLAVSRDMPRCTYSVR